MEYPDFCNSVICALKSEELIVDDFCKLLTLVTLFEYAWVNKKTSNSFINNLLKELNSNERFCQDNLDQLSDIIECEYMDDIDMIRFVRAAKILFETYRKSGDLYQLRNKLYFKNKRFMEQFCNIKKGIIIGNE